MGHLQFVTVYAIAEGRAVSAALHLPQLGGGSRCHTGAKIQSRRHVFLGAYPPKQKKFQPPQIEI